MVVYFQNLYMALYNNIFLNFTVYKDINTCDDYLKISFNTFTPTEYIDIIFNMTYMPECVSYVIELFEYIKNKNIISLSNDGLGYIFQGPCLKTSTTQKLFYMFVQDYNRVLQSKNDIIYDFYMSRLLADKFLKPIYEDIKK